MKITFLKSHLFLFLVRTLMFKKKNTQEKKKRKNEGMLHLSLVFQHSFATLWLNTASSECCFILPSFIYLLLLKHFNRPVVSNTDRYRNSLNTSWVVFCFSVLL